MCGRMPGLTLRFGKCKYRLSVKFQLQTNDEELSLLMPQAVLGPRVDEAIICGLSAIQTQPTSWSV